jgi:hypothetical protein
MMSAFSDAAKQQIGSAVACILVVGYLQQNNKHYHFKWHISCFQKHRDYNYNFHILVCLQSQLKLFLFYTIFYHNISVAIAGIYEQCNNLAQQDAPLKNKTVPINLIIRLDH